MALGNVRIIDVFNVTLEWKSREILADLQHLRENWAEVPAQEQTLVEIPTELVEIGRYVAALAALPKC